jgi:hypothetical protein
MAKREKDQWDRLLEQIDFHGMTQEGRYNVTIRVALDEKALAKRSMQLPDSVAATVVEMHITLDVLDEALPPQKLLHTQWFHTDCLADFYKTGVFSEEHWKIIDLFMEPMVSRYGISMIIDALSDFSFYEKGILEHPVPANDAIRPFLKAKIPGLWIYYCVGQSYLVPNRFIALSSPRTRAMGVLMYYFNIAGFFAVGV